jgi:FkbM family methyltransferase
LQRENAARVDILAENAARVLDGVELMATTIGELRSRLYDVDERIGAVGSRDPASARELLNLIAAVEHQLEGLRDAGAGRLTGDDHGELIAGAIDTHDRKSADRLDVMREQLLEAIRATPRETHEHGGSGADIDLGLCAFLAPFLREPKAIDVGAHRGLYARALLDQGIDVVAVEPNPELAAELSTCLKDNARATVRQAAASDGVGSARLYLVEDATDDRVLGDETLFSSLFDRENVHGMRFVEGPTVETVTIDAIRTEHGWPEAVGLVKIDVEGAELRVIDGMGATHPEVVMLEYWGDEFVLRGTNGSPGFATLIDGVQQLGLRRWVTLIHEGDTVSYAVNNRSVPPASWGNVAFVRDRDTFLAILMWCQDQALSRYVDRPAIGS